MSSVYKKPTFFVNPLARGVAGYNQRGPVIINGRGVTPYGVVRGNTFYPNPIAPNPSYIVPTPSAGIPNTSRSSAQPSVQPAQTQVIKSTPLSTTNPTTTYIPPFQKLFATLSSSSYREGSSLTVNLNAKSIAGTTVYYSIQGNGIDSSDFQDIYGGQVRLDAWGQAQQSIPIASDLKTEGTETFQIDFYSDLAKTVRLGSTGSASITDTSFTPPAKDPITGLISNSRGQVSTITTSYANEPTTPSYTSSVPSSPNVTPFNYNNLEGSFVGSPGGPNPVYLENLAKMDPGNPSAALPFYSFYGYLPTVPTNW